MFSPGKFLFTEIEVLELHKFVVAVSAVYSKDRFFLYSGHASYISARSQERRLLWTLNISLLLYFSLWVCCSCYQVVLLLGIGGSGIRESTSFKMWCTLERASKAMRLGIAFRLVFWGPLMKHSPNCKGEEGTVKQQISFCRWGTEGNRRGKPRRELL